MTDQLQILLEEWKQNVALYIDQDKRGLERTKMFLTVHAGLLVAWGVLWKVPHDLWSTCAGLATASMGIFLTVITQRMSKRAHAFILLRITQAILVEEKIKDILAPSTPWSTSSGIITTFVREHFWFKRDQDIPDQWKPLIAEVKEFDPDALKPRTFEGVWRYSIGHLRWLMLLHYGLYILWGILGFLTVVACILEC